MIVVHHLNNSRSQRILWLLEELGLDYEIKHYQRDAKTMLAPAELRTIHPLGKSPVVTDGDRVLAESGAIVSYFADQYDNGSLMPPAGSDKRLRCNYWLHYAEGSAMPPLLLKLVFQRAASAPMPFFVRPVVRMVVRRWRGATDGWLETKWLTDITGIKTGEGKSSGFGAETACRRACAR